MLHSIAVTTWGECPLEALVQYLRQWQGGYVQVERGGPDACQGWLQDLQADYLVLRSDLGTDLYLPLHHIRSISPLPAEGPPPAPASAPGAPAPARFADLLRMHLGRRVRLYHSGPELSIGVLRECTDEYALLEAWSGELVCFTLYHIRSLYLPGDEPDSVPPEIAEPQWGR